MSRFVMWLASVAFLGGVSLSGSLVLSKSLIGISSQKKSENKRESLEKEKVTSVSHKKPPVTMAAHLNKQ